MGNLLYKHVVLKEKSPDDQLYLQKVIHHYQLALQELKRAEKSDPQAIANRDYREFYKLKNNRWNSWAVK